MRLVSRTVLVVSFAVLSGACGGKEAGDGPAAGGTGGGGSGGAGGGAEGGTGGPAPFCGDGYTDPELGEACDDGNDRDDDGCAPDCTIVPRPLSCDDASPIGNGVTPGSFVSVGTSRFPGTCGTTGGGELLFRVDVGEGGLLTYRLVTEDPLSVSVLAACDVDAVLDCRTPLDTGTLEVPGGEVLLAVDRPAHVGEAYFRLELQFLPYAGPGEACLPEPCRAGFYCGADEAGEDVCLPNTAPTLGDATARLGGGAGELVIELAGADAEGNVRRWPPAARVRPLDASGAPLTAYGAPVAWVLPFERETAGEAAFEATVLVREFGRDYPSARRLALALRDTGGLESAERIVDIAIPPLRQEGETCDRTGAGDRCAVGLVCWGRPSTCHAGLPPTVEEVSFTRWKGCPGGRIRVEGLDPDDDAHEIRLAFLDERGQPATVPIDGAERHEVFRTVLTKNGRLTLEQDVSTSSGAVGVRVSIRDRSGLTSVTRTAGLEVRDRLEEGDRCGGIAACCPDGLTCRGSPPACSGHVSPAITLAVLWKRGEGSYSLAAGFEDADADGLTVDFWLYDEAGEPIVLQDGTSKVSVPVEGQAEGGFRIELEGPAAMVLGHAKVRIVDARGYVGGPVLAPVGPEPGHEDGSPCRPGVLACVEGLTCAAEGGGFACRDPVELRAAACEAAPLVVPRPYFSTWLSRPVVAPPSLWEPTCSETGGGAEAVFRVRVDRPASFLAAHGDGDEDDLRSVVSVFPADRCPEPSDVPLACAAGWSAATLEPVPPGDYFVIVDTDGSVGAAELGVLLEP